MGIILISMRYSQNAAPELLIQPTGSQFLGLLSLSEFI